MIGNLFRISTLVLVLGTLGACASSKTIGASLDDFNASQTLRGSLLLDRGFDYSDIDITIYEGRLLLTGTMRSEEGHRKLLASAWKAENVIQVIDEIFVGDKTPRGQGLVDGRIDQAISTKLITDRGVTSADYKVAVSGGVVYILGVARDDIALDRTLNHARSTSGVKQVVSHVIFKDDPTRTAIRY